MTPRRIATVAGLAAGILVPLAAQAAPYGATYAPNPISCLTPNQVKTHAISLTNTGTNAWTITRPYGYHLAYHWFQGPTAVVYEGERTYLPNQVDANLGVALQANLKAPAAVGTYTLQWDMVHEGVTWFSTQGVPTGNQTVEVKASCLTLGKAPGLKFTAPPKIEQIVPFISNVTPGGTIAIKGSWFGTVKGDARLTGIKRWNGTAYGGTGHLWLEIVTEPGKDFWKPTTILARVPSYITQVQDQPAKLQVKTTSGQWSNDLDVQFRAARQYATLPRTDSAVKMVSCGDDSNKDVCQPGWVDPDDGDWFSSSCGQTFYGFHLNCWGCVGDDAGTDKFEITLKNGWVIDGGKVYVNVDDGEGFAFRQEVPSGVASWKPSIQWSVTPNDALCHGADVYISGPKGVPWK
jgi:hypothetical protein